MGVFQMVAQYPGEKEMKVKASLPVLAFQGETLSPVLEAYFEINHLKQLYRQGWLKRGIPPEQCESVAEHVFGMAMLAWWLIDRHDFAVDAAKVARMVLIHEIGEVYTGDLTPSDHVSVAEKHRRERTALEKILQKLSRAQDYIALWEEYERNETAEARLVRQIDRLEMALQALIYERQAQGDMIEFFQSAGRAISDEPLRTLFAEATALRARDLP